MYLGNPQGATGHSENHCFKQIRSHQVPAWKNFIFCPNVEQISPKFDVQNFVDNLAAACLQTVGCHSRRTCTRCSYQASCSACPSRRTFRHSALPCPCCFLPGTFSSLFAWTTPYSLRSNSNVSTLKKSFLSLLAS